MRASSSRRRGFTLLELLVAVTLLATISGIIYGSFHQSFRVRNHTQKVYDRYRDVRQSLFRMSREISSAYISLHNHPEEPVTASCFVGEKEKMTFSSMSHLRLVRDADTSDQSEISYFLKRTEASDGRRTSNLMRREDTTPDDNVEKGGRVEIMAEDIKELRFEYWEPGKEIAGDAWTDDWEVGYCKAGDMPSADDKLEMPERVRITLVVEAPGKRKRDLEFVTQAPIMMRRPLDF